jgi:K+-sensing histidine kinase KdpD
MKITQLGMKQILGVPLLLVATALLLTCVLSQFLPFTPHIVFVGAISLSVLLGGIKAGLVSLLGTVISINYFYTAPLYALTLGVDDLWRLVFFSIALTVVGLQQRYLVHREKPDEPQL